MLRGWEDIGDMLTGKSRQCNIFEKAEAPSSWAVVDIKRVSVERIRSFGDIYLALMLWHRLGFADFCNKHMPEGREAIPWSFMACILTVARFCAPSSELKIAESWYQKTALDALLGVPADRTAKHDLGMRPIYHHKKDRTQAHIFVCFLSLAMWRTLQQWMKASGLGTSPMI